MTDLTTTFRDRLGLASPVLVEFQRSERRPFAGFDRERIESRGLEGDLIPAFLFTPTACATLGGVVVFHQHNGEFHFGKSEVAGEVEAGQTPAHECADRGSRAWTQHDGAHAR